MSVKSVEVDVDDKKAINAGDEVTMVVKGVTKLKEVPPNGSFKVYNMPGHNLAEGGLTDKIMQIDANGNFIVTVSTKLDAASVQPPLVDWGLDIFLGRGGSDEGMCIGIASDKYVAQSRAKPGEFEMYCKDNGDGSFTKQTTPDPVGPVNCVLN